MELDLVIVGEQNELTNQTVGTALTHLPRQVKPNVFIEPYEGYNKSLNIGAKKGNAPTIGFLNNDLIFLEHWFHPLMKALEVYGSVSPWCPKTHHKWWGSEVPSEPTEGYEISKIITGWAIFTKRSVWEQINGFDERLEFWCCDNSYSEQLKNHNLTHALIPSSKVIHLMSQTLNSVGEKKRDELTHQQAITFNNLYDKNIKNLGKDLSIYLKDNRLV